MFFARVFNKRKIKRSLERTFKKFFVIGRARGNGDKQVILRRSMPRLPSVVPDVVVTRRPMPRVPVEVLDMIMKHHHKDKALLMACSIVSSQWHGSAQRCLFHSFRVSLNSAHTNSDPEFGRFIKFFTTVTHIKYFITSLCIRAASLSKQSLVVDTKTRMVALIGMLPALQHLTFEDVSFIPREPGARADEPVVLSDEDGLVVKERGVLADEHGALLKESDAVPVEPFAPVTIKTLNLWGIRMRIDDPEELLDLFVVNTTLEMVFSLFQSLVGGPEIARSMSVQHLKVKNPLDCFPRFGRGTTFPRLRALSFDLMSVTGNGVLFHDNTKPTAVQVQDTTAPGCHDNMDDFLRQHGSNLDFLRLNVRHIVVPNRDIDSEDSWTVFHLDNVCPKLQTLHIGFKLDLLNEKHLDPSKKPEWRRIVDFLSRVISAAPKTLTTIIFGIRINVPSWLRAEVKVTRYDVAEAKYGWTELQKAMNPAHFGNLKVVKFVEQETHSAMVDFEKPLDPVYQRFFAANLEDLERKGMLFFD
ncbi:hypothetical protein EUX98_g4394 [Antrodiella citrinella]|uniref:F-box domain-containing protein n=1 Tax=Antrodiella citrinella TaxID=2447956 RepID=A0A4S4MU98_9APHY|nr:hypothetical protein EUX98_g4394 [Antrodiella citrinella]